MADQQPAPAAVAAPPNPPPVTPVGIAGPSPTRPAIPSLQGVVLSTFGRRDDQYLTYAYPVQINGQNTLPGATYDQMLQLVNADLPITRVNFIRMWKTLILKRTQDVYEKEYHIRAEHFVRLDRSIHTPAPLSDLLYSLGEFSSHARGIHLHITPPARAAPPPPWWDIDNAIVQQWNTMCHRMATLYTMREYPSASDYRLRPLVTLNINDDANGFRSVRAYTNEATPSDAYIRFMNDELFVPDNGITYDASSYSIVDRLHRASALGAYVGSYVLQSNS